jgi:hypothetical protein
MATRLEFLRGGSLVGWLPVAFRSKAEPATPVSERHTSRSTAALRVAFNIRAKHPLLAAKQR